MRRVKRKAKEEEEEEEEKKVVSKKSVKKKKNEKDEDEKHVSKSVEKPKSPKKTSPQSKIVNKLSPKTQSLISPDKQQSQGTPKKTNETTLPGLVEYLKDNESFENCFVTFDTTAVEGCPSGIAEEQDKDGKVLLLLRESTQILMKDILLQQTRSKTTKRILSKGRILDGPGGAGKSFTLYQLVHFCRELGWLVLYIPEMKQLLALNDKAAAMRILRSLEKNLPPQLKDTDFGKFLNEKLEKYNENSLVDVFDFLRNQTSVCLFIAIDQWNAVFTTSNQDHLMVKIFKEYSALNMDLGLTYCAVSSSFEPLGVMPDADASTFKFSITLYSPKELELILSSSQKRGELPVLTEVDQKKLITETGKVPRNIFFMKQTYKSTKALNWSDFNERVSTYYRDRVSNIMSQDKNTAFAADVYLNRGLDAITPFWKNSGLFTCVDGSWVSVCPAATRALIQQLHSEVNEAISLLVRDKTTSWRALELFVVAAFQRKEPVIIPNTTLKGVPIKSPVNYVLECDKVVQQSSPTTVEKLPKGTLLQCYPNHPVVDCVLHTSQGELFFIQVSETYYLDHSTRLGDLDINVVGKTQKTVLEYYCEATGRDNILSDENRVHYIYVTTCPTLVPTNSRSPCSKDKVILVTGQNLRFFGDGYQLFFHPST